jgi:hypothetical protein
MFRVPVLERKNWKSFRFFVPNCGFSPVLEHPVFCQFSAFRDLRLNPRLPPHQKKTKKNHVNLCSTLSKFGNFVLNWPLSPVKTVVSWLHWKSVVFGAKKLFPSLICVRVWNRFSSVNFCVQRGPLIKNSHLKRQSVFNFVLYVPNEKERTCPLRSCTTLVCYTGGYTDYT